MNTAMALTTYSNFFDHAPIPLLVSNAAHQVSRQSQSHFMQTLKSLSKQNKWIFITANTSMPNCDILLKHGIDLNKLVRLKASHQLTESETIQKAKKLGTASAIICNSTCYYYSHSTWLELKRNHTLVH
ncbi:hypothetical protein ACU5DF_10475 [Aliivibrio wodanis]|uniref:Uncharacterized protein n=1 Tax=Aliivibrio wodanis TaxID=80852 RepID=A0A090KJD0_9GAMM|nr:putative uncharacterized protein [Aliivibrio wodanis]VVV04320.1 hypothetical protein AW0309160_01704 [Aliivibrio wodanis]